MGRSEVVVFNGTRFRRYPDSDHESDRRYFTPGIGDRQKGIKRLHEEVWMAEYGAIPDGYHVHHKDHDTLNNHISNLECLDADEHRAHHAEDARERGLSTERLEHLERIRPLAAPWHSSPEGVEWHRQNALKQMATRDDPLSPWGKRVATDRTCEQCGGTYRSRAVQDGRFCSNACKSAWRRKAGLDNVGRACERCGDSFRCNRYARTRFCSRKCGRRSPDEIGQSSRQRWETAPTIQRVCEWCSGTYESRAPKGRRSRYCSASCGSRAAHAEAPLHDLTCAHCGSQFQNKKSTTRTCSRSCAAYYRNAQRAARVQPDSGHAA